MNQFNDVVIAAVGDDLQTAQRNSNDFKDIIQYLENRELPDDAKTAKRIIAESQYYVIVDNTLYHLYYHGSRGVPKAERLVRQLAVPESYREQALEAYHDAIAGGGHTGIERTYHNLRLKYYWPKMYKDVYEHVHSCKECQQAKRAYKAKPAPLHPLPIGDIFSRWHVDILGPLPETSKKEKYVLVLVDSYTKWCEAFPLKTQTSYEIKDCLFEHFARYGAPACLMSDRGANFLSKIVAALCELFQVKRLHTSSYHAMGNGQCERFNSVIGRGLRTYLDEHQDNWSSYLQGILMAYRAAPVTSTKYSPYFLVFGREMLLPFDVSLKPKESLGKNVQEHLTEILNNLEEARKIATANMQKAQEKYKEQYDKSSAETHFLPGDKVLVYNPHVPKGRASKLWKKWTGPYYITQQGPNHTFQLRLCSDNSALKALVHANRLKHFFGRDAKQTQAERVASQQPADPQSATASAHSQQSQAEAQEINNDTAVTQSDSTQSCDTPAEGFDPDQWYKIDKILACKRQRQQVLYKVKWSSTGKTEWLNANDVAQDAREEFHRTRVASGRLRKKPLQRHKFFMDKTDKDKKRN